MFYMIPLKIVGCFVHFLTVYRNDCFKKLLFFLFLTPPSLENAMFAKFINKEKL